MKYCTDCGSLVTRRLIESDARERSICSQCGKIHFENPKVLVACIAYNAARIVMCRRAEEPARGLWTPPSGFVEMGETVEAAATREAAEEAGLEIESSQLIPYAITSLPHLSQIYISFRAAIAEPSLKTGPESSEVALFSEADMPWDEIAFAGAPSFLRIFFKECRSGRFSLHLGMNDAVTRARREFMIG